MIKNRDKPIMFYSPYMPDEECTDLDFKHGDIVTTENLPGLHVGTVISVPANGFKPGNISVLHEESGMRGLYLYYTRDLIPFRDVSPDVYLARS